MLTTHVIGSSVVVGEAAGKKPGRYASCLTLPPFSFPWPPFGSTASTWQPQPSWTNCHIQERQRSVVIYRNSQQHACYYYYYNYY